MAKQQLHRSEVLRAAVDQRRFRAADRVCAICSRIEAKLLHPAFQDPRVLARPEVRRVMNTAGEQEVLGCVFCCMTMARVATCSP
jgi:hypothetical protein